jgi:hypothetical protein
MKRTLSLKLPEEFLELCTEHGVTPETVLRGFIADLCSIENLVGAPRTDSYSSNGSDERDLAWEYYRRVGYPFLNRTHR